MTKPLCPPPAHCSDAAMCRGFGLEVLRESENPRGTVIAELFEVCKDCDRDAF